MSREIYHYHDADFANGVRADVYAATGEAWSEGRPYSSLTRNYTKLVIIQDTVLSQRQFAGHGTIIITSHVFPPIPDRRYDWCAVLDDYDGAPDAGYQPMGWGPTEEAAVDDLNAQLEDV